MPKLQKGRYHDLSHVEWCLLRHGYYTARAIVAIWLKQGVGTRRMYGELAREHWAMAMEAKAAT